MKNQNILIAGAHGTTGKIIVDTLKNMDGYTPVAMVRKQDQKNDFEQQNVSAVLADLEEDVSHALKNIDKVIFAAGSGGKKVVAVDQEGAKRLIDAAKTSNAKKFVMLSSMGADDPSQNEDLQDYLKAKQNADNYLMKSGLSYSIVRPGALTNDNGTGTIELKQKFDKQGKITRADVAKTLVSALEDDVRPNQVFEILGGDTAINKALKQE